mgnify:CR=1 FL=1
MKGQLGSLWVGRNQVGGILGWSLDLFLTDYSKDTATYYKLAKWKLTAESYWLFDIPTKVTIKLYSGSKGYWEGKGIVTSSVKHLWDTLIHESIEIIGEGILEGKE